MFERAIKFILLVLLLGVGAAIFFWPPRKTSAAPPGFTTVLYWEKWTGEEAEHMRRIVDDFNNSVGREKRIFVEFVSMTAVDQKTLVATAAGVPPDICGFWDAQLVQFAAQNALEPLDDLAAEHGISQQTYKPILWKGCNWHGHLWALCSTPWATALLYNKQTYIDHGLDPDQPPATIAQLDQMATQLTTYQQFGGRQRMATCGFLPLEPDWYLSTYPPCFGGDFFDPDSGKLLLHSQPVRACYGWIADYPKRLGKSAVSDFRSGLSSASAQNPFLVGQIAMERLGPWMANFTESFAPQMNRWHVPPEKLARLNAYETIPLGISVQAAIAQLGEPDARAGQHLTWDASIRIIELTFDSDQKLIEKQLTLAPAAVRRQHCAWAYAPFPGAAPGMKNTGYVAFDALAVPRGSQHKREAFEFIAYVNRQDVAEKLCKLQCCDSPLKNVSQDFLERHPNPYIETFEAIANNPNAWGVTQIPIYAQVNDELHLAADRCALLEQTPDEALADIDQRLQKTWDEYRRVDALRRQQGGS